MDRPTFNHRKSGDTNPKGRSRSPLLELYARSLKSEREEKIGARSFCRLRRQTAPGLYVRRGQKDGKRDYKLSTETGQVHCPTWPSDNSAPAYCPAVPSAPAATILMAG